MIKIVFLLCYFMLSGQPLGCWKVALVKTFPTKTACAAWAMKNGRAVGRYHAPARMKMLRGYHYSVRFACLIKGQKIKVSEFSFAKKSPRL